MSKILKISLTLLLLSLIGCQSAVKPEYTLIGTDNRPISIMGEAVSIKDGWEFCFPEAFDVQSMNIYCDGNLLKVTLYCKTEGGWKEAKTVNVDGSYPCTVELNVKTDAIRVFPKFSGEGNIISCDFNVAKKQNIFSIPLEKPPFIK